MQHGKNGDTPPRLRRIREVVQQCFRRRERGESLSDKDIIEANPELMPELAHELHHLRIVHAALKQPSPGVNAQAFLDGLPQDAAQPRSLHVRCPHCQSQIEIAVDVQLDNITCSSCGSHFSLVQDEMTTRAASTMRTVGHFQLIEQLGVGGFGTVWKARDTQLDRTVAVKIPRRGRLASTEVEQFLREARAAAQLNHPNIVNIFEVGRDGEAVYIVSDLVCGISLADRLRAREWLSAREAAELCAKVAEALVHAHQAGVVHRDLKPHNIMLDEDGEPHLMDFGLARRDAEEVTMTMDGQVLGTPAYMSPEQARGEAHTADGRMDLYSLGVILFELLTGELPFRGNARMLIHQVLNEEPPSPRDLNGNVPRDLETICLKCLEKQPTKRYPTAKSVRDELCRFVDGKPIQARPISIVEHCWRWSKRKPLTAAMIVIVLFVAIGTALVAVNRAHLLKQTRVAARQTRLQRYVSDIGLASRFLHDGNVDQAKEILDEHSGTPESHSVEWRLLRRLCQGDETFTLPLQRQTHKIAISPDGGLIAIASSDDLPNPDEPPGIVSNSNTGELTLHSPSSHETRTLRRGPNPPTSVTFSRDGKLLVTGNADGSIDLWTGEDYRQRRTIHSSHKESVLAVAFSPNGNFLATGSADKRVVLWKYSDQGVESIWEQENLFRVLTLDFDRDSSLLAVAGVATSLVLIDVNARTIRRIRWPDGWIRSLVFSPHDKDLLYIGNVNTLVKRLDVHTEKVDTIGQHQRSVSSLAFSSDGETLVSAGGDRTIRLWNYNSGQPLGILKGHSETVLDVAFAPDGMTLYSVSADKTLRFWPAQAPSYSDVVARSEKKQWIRAIDFSADGKWLVTGEASGRLRVYDVVRQKVIHEAECPSGITALAIHPLRRFIVVGNRAGDVQIWDDNLRHVKTTSGAHAGQVFHVAMSPDANFFVTTTREWTKNTPGEVILWNAKALSVQKKLIAHKTGTPTATFTRDGRMLVTGGNDGRIRVWHVPSVERVHEFSGHEHSVLSAAISHDGRLLATGGGGIIMMWDLNSATKVKEIRGNAGTVECLAISPDDRTLISGHMNGAIKFWNLETERELLTLRGHDGFLQETVLSPDGQILASASADGTVRVWPSLQYRSPQNERN